MKTRKIMFCLILAVCLIFCLIGCGLSTDINSVTDNTSEDTSNDISAEEVSSTVPLTKDPLLGSGTAGTKSIAANISQLGTTSLDTVSFSNTNVYRTYYYSGNSQGNYLDSGTGYFGSYGSTIRTGTTINSASINLCFTGTAATLLASGSLRVTITATVEATNTNVVTHTVGYKTGTALMGVDTQSSLLSGFSSIVSVQTNSTGEYATDTVTFTPAAGQTYLCIGVGGHCYASSILYARRPGQIVRDVRIQCIDTSSEDTTAPTITAPTFSEWVADSRTVSYIANDDIAIDRITVNYGAVASTTTRNSATQLTNEFTANYTITYDITATDIAGNETTYTCDYRDYKLDGYAPKISQALFVRSTDNSILVTNGLTPTIGGNWAGEATCYILVQDYQSTATYSSGSIYSSGLNTVTYEGTPCTLVTSPTTISTTAGGGIQTTSIAVTSDGAIGKAWYKVEGITANITNAQVVVTDNLNKSSSYSITLSNISTTTEDFIIGNGVVTRYFGTTTNIIIPSRATSIASNVFLEKNGTICFEAGSAMTAIGTYAFAGFLGTSITLPSTITSIGASAFRECVNLTNTTIPSSVTSIGTYAYYNCNSLESNLVIPDTITSIGNYTFYNCHKIEHLSLGNGITNIGTYAFYNCQTLESIVIPNVVISIGTYAFYDCGITNVVLGSNVASIGDYAFANCYYLEDINFPTNLTSIGAYSFYNCIRLGNIIFPDSLTTIGNYAFWNCNEITSISIGSGLINLGFCALAECTDLLTIDVHSSNTAFKTINSVLYNYDGTTLILYPADKTDTAFTIPTGVINIAPYSFYNCNSLSSIVISNTVTNIEDFAFRNTRLTNITIGSNITNIEVGAFSDCSTLTAINVDSANTTYKSINGVLYDYSNCILIAYPKGKTAWDFTIPSGVTTIGDYAFSDCYNLRTITIPSSVTSIGAYAFNNCSYLNNIIIPSNVTSIGEYAFIYCDNLTTITIPTGVTSIKSHTFCYSGLRNIVIPNNVTIIEDNAFAYCYSLESVTIGSSVTTIDEKAFYLCTSLSSIVIPNLVTSIGNEAFNSCIELTSISIGSGLTSLGQYAFATCRQLSYINVDSANTYFKTVNDVLYNYAGTQLILYPACKSDTTFNIPSGVLTINAYAFNECRILENIIIPNTVTKIEEYSFWGCSNLEYISLGQSSVTSIGDRAFLGCSNLASIILPYGLTKIGEYSFADCGFSSLIIPNTVTYIEELAFHGCVNLLDVTIGSGVSYIGTGAFARCTSITSINVDSANISFASIDGVLYNYAGTTLISYPAQKAVTSFTIPDGVSTIKKYAFYSNYLTNIIVPDTVTVIEYSAFDSINGTLTSIIFESITPAIIAIYAIEYNIPLYVPASSVDAYKAAWTQYANWIYPIP